MMRLLLILAVVSTPFVSAHSEESESYITLRAGAAFPLVASPNATDFANMTWLAGGAYDFGLSDNIRLGVRMTHILFDGRTKVETDVGGSVFLDDLEFGASAWTPELYSIIDILPGYAVRSQLIVGGGYAWLIYDSLRLNGDALNDVPDDFAEGTLSASAGLRLQVRPWPHFVISLGAEYTRHFDGL